MINLRNTFSNRGLGIIISCYTTQGHENPFWIVSNDDYSSGPLMNTGAITVELGGGNITIEIISREQLYETHILINAGNGVEFTGNLTCRSQSNSEAQYTVTVTTSKSVSFIFYMNIIKYW